MESPGCIREAITAATLVVSGGLLFVFGAGKTTSALPDDVPCIAKAGRAGRGGGEVGGVEARRGEATVGAVYLWSRRAAGCQSLQLLRSVAGEEIRAAGGAAQPLHQRGDDAAAAAAHRLAHLASRRRKNKVRNFRKKEEKKRRWGGVGDKQTAATSCSWVRLVGVFTSSPQLLLLPGCIPRGADPQVLRHQHQWGGEVRGGHNPDAAAAAARLNPEKLSRCKL